MMGSIQQRSLGIALLRIRITCDVQTDAAGEQQELPLIAGILADLSGDWEPTKEMPLLKNRRMADADRATFADFMRQIIDVVLRPVARDSLTAAFSSS
jgi:type VI secretion system ImpB/VipA family protein